MKILVTGGAGFIGSAVANYLHEQGHGVDILDCYTYAADTSRLKYGFQRHNIDIRHPIVLDEQYDYILHLAAETHVDNSITNPGIFVETNVVGTFNVLEFARKQKNLKTLLYFSTDEVFGPAPKGVDYKEWDRYNSGNPYSATKAGAEELVLAYGNTYKLPIIITHTMNAFGDSQHEEKFIPKTVLDVLAGRKVIVHADATKSTAGSRFYIHTDNIAKGVEFVLREGQLQDKYNIVGSREVTNLEIAQKVAKILDKPLRYEMVDFHSSRPGHDLRYALDGKRLEELGWGAPDDFDERLAEIVLSMKERYENSGL